jgi:hypothetical protein
MKVIVNRLMLVVLLFELSSTGVYAQEDSRCGIQPDEKTQRLLTDVFRPPPDADEKELQRKMEQLIQLTRSDMPGLLRQVVLYETVQKERGQPFGYGLSYTLFDVSRANIAPEGYPDAISVFLYCADAGVRKEAWKLFARGLKRYPDLSHLRDHVTGGYQQQAFAEPLKRAIFEAAPTAAFFFYSGEWRAREVERDEIIHYRRKWRTVDNALFEKKTLGGLSGGKVNEETATALRELAESKHWWSRLFVAEMMVQNKEFRDPDVIERLKKDDNELVRHSVASLENPDPLRATPVDK